MNGHWYCNWTFRCTRGGRIVWQENIHNLLVTQGNKAITDVFMRAHDSTYFPSGDFYVGLYHGSVSKVTTLATIPGEPSGNGYSRNLIERSDVGFPTMELDDDGDWRVVSKEVTITATGGSIGPIDGGFLGTSLDDSGTLIGVVATSVQRTVIAGDSMTIQLRAKVK